MGSEINSPSTLDRVGRVSWAIVIFLVTNILVAIVGGAVAVFLYWRWSDPKRTEEPRANEDGL
jgi:hypothetical protein